MNFKADKINQMQFIDINNSITVGKVAFHQPVSEGLSENHSVIAPAGHSSTQAPHSTHLSLSMTATSSIVMASWGHTSAQAPQATQSLSITFTIP